MSMEELIDKQKQLMKTVPHEVSPQSLTLMVQGIKIIEILLRYLNSTGHKPWRPEPLATSVQDQIMDELAIAVSHLRSLHIYRPSMSEDTPIYGRRLISALGVIEETVEYIESVEPGQKPDRPHQLEEHVDVLFFWMEQAIMGGFSWEQMEAEYHRKWAVNIDRYHRAEEGDFSWDKRSEGKL